MTTVKLLSQLRGLGVKLWLDGDRLRYSAPPGALGPALLAQLAARKAEVVDFLRDADAAGAPPPVRPVGRDRALPLSYAQTRLWLLDRLGPGGPAYHLPV